MFWTPSFYHDMPLCKKHLGNYIATETWTLQWVTQKNPECTIYWYNHKLRSRYQFFFSIWVYGFKKFTYLLFSFNKNDYFCQSVTCEIKRMLHHNHHIYQNHDNFYCETFDHTAHHYHVLHTVSTLVMFRIKNYVCTNSHAATEDQYKFWLIYLTMI